MTLKLELGFQIVQSPFHTIAQKTYFLDVQGLTNFAARHICICYDKRFKRSSFVIRLDIIRRKIQLHSFDLTCNIFFTVHILSKFTYKRHSRRQNCNILVLNNNTKRTFASHFFNATALTDYSTQMLDSD